MPFHRAPRDVYSDFQWMHMDKPVRDVHVHPLVLGSGQVWQNAGGESTQAFYILKIKPLQHNFCGSNLRK
ncbi:hypothetical protein KSZ_00360 [Dictyobacter formicarum]|uniref:Uncharacterized protein n=2 Tax=Dictyobacter formicarum TaxID=2778368 RepID=A0ABQ3V810_9CHLR|nr:hypothetical protein KSZ_00360 [Dictyobacter formicarum]